MHAGAKLKKTHYVIHKDSRYLRSRNTNVTNVKRLQHGTFL